MPVTGHWRGGECSLREGERECSVTCGVEERTISERRREWGRLARRTPVLSIEPTVRNRLEKEKKSHRDPDKTVRLRECLARTLLIAAFGKGTAGGTEAMRRTKWTFYPGGGE